MITKQAKQKILETIKDKDERILISGILDKAIKFEKTDSLFFSNFLNLNEFDMIERVLNHFKIKFYEFYANKDCEKRNIAFIPDYLLESKDNLFSEHVSCIKIISNSKGKLFHKDYMGAIYSLGIRREYIGDIILNENVAYFFCMNSVKDYFILNLLSVGKYDVITEVVDIFSNEVEKLSFNFIEKEYIIPSYRVDALLSEVYNLSRSEVKDKIIKGDLYINDKSIFYPNTLVTSGDIISFKRCGKLKVGEEVRKTKSNNIVLKVFRYS